MQSTVKKMKRKLIIALTAAVLLAGSALAAREAYGSFDGNSPTAAIVVDGDSITDGVGFTGQLTKSGTVSAAQIAGVRIIGAGTDNGVVIRKSTGGSIAIGGDEAVYDIDDDGVLDFNSVIILDGGSDDTSVEGKYATGIFTDCGDAAARLTIDNTYIKTTGYRAPTILSRATDFDIAFRKCYLESEGGGKSFMPNFKLMVGSARATCLMNENTWFYDTIIRAKDWGAVSLDTTPYANVYMVNTYAEAYGGGYGLYAVNGTTTNMYGSKILAAQYGMFLMGSGSVVMDSITAANETAMKYDDGKEFEYSATDDGRSFAAGLVNAAVVHVNSGVGTAGLKNPASLVVKNAVLSTMAKDVSQGVLSDISFDNFADYLKAPIKDQGASWFYLNHCMGSLVAVRSAGVDITFGEDSELRPANGVIVQSLIGYDSDAGNIYNDSSLKNAANISPITVNIEAPTQGDILHEDYQRYMHINISADYTGLIRSGTIKTWNALWSDAALDAALTDVGYTGKDFDVAANGDAIRGWLIRETGSYPKTYGAAVTLTGGAKWTVTGGCSLSSLTVGKDCELVLPDGYSIYVNCNSDYSYLTGEKLDKPQPGATYNMVAIACFTGFSDVDESDWFCADVTEAAKLGLINGMGDGTFAPGEYLTLAQTVKLASTLMELKLNGKCELKNADPWYAEYVDYALSKGIIEKEFDDWSAPATRSQAAYIFGNFLPALGLQFDTGATISDVAEDSEYHDQISALYSAEVLTGYEDGSFRGDGFIRRSEMASILVRMANLIK